MKIGRKVYASLAATGEVDFCLFFFVQAEDGIRDVAVTGVQTCALPIYFHGADYGSEPRHRTRSRSRARIRGLARAVRRARCQVGTARKRRRKSSTRENPNRLRPWPNGFGRGTNGWTRSSTTPALIEDPHVRFGTSMCSVHCC